MKSQWIATDTRIGTRRAIYNTVSKEYEINGVYGYIWEYSSTHYRAIITSAKIARKHLPEQQWPTQKDDETLITFPKKDISKWIKILRISASPNLMLRRV